MTVLTEDELAFHSDDEALLQSTVFAVGATLDGHFTLPLTPTSNLLKHIAKQGKKGLFIQRSSTLYPFG